MAIQPSPTLAMTARARKMQADGMDVLSFAAGEPDFNTPDPICQAAIQAIHDGMTKYTPTAGAPALREAVAAKLLRENKIPAKASEVMVSCGAKHSLCNALLAVIEPGDEVILLAPFWMTYADQVRLAGGVPVIVTTKGENGFVPDYDEIRSKITSRTKALMVNSPSNPTGAALGRGTMKELVALAIRHGFWIISDEIYERLTYGHEHVSPASLGKEAASQTITVTGCSKTYSMTGWRIGFAHAPENVIQAMSNLQDQVTSNATSFAQAGAIAALQLPEAAVEEMRSEFEGRRRLILDRLSAMPGIRVHEPQGAFYVFPDVTAFLGGDLPDDAALAEHLLKESQIACIPGSVFYGPGHLRFSYAASRQTIEQGMDRLAAALARLLP